MSIKEIKVDSIVDIKFGGGIEGEATGKVTEPKLGGGDFRFVLTEDFWNPLSKCWHRKGEEMIAHAQELMAVRDLPA